MDSNNPKYIDVWWLCHAETDEDSGYYKFFENKPIWETMDIDEYIHGMEVLPSWM